MKLKAFLIVAALGLGAALAGCETMSAEECAVADWRGLGFNDAAGSGASRFADRAESCGERGIAADGAAYQSGFAEGMHQFCQPPNAFQFARNGGAFAGSCPAELQGPFYAAFNDGQRVHAAEAELQSVRSRISTLESRQDGIEDDIRSTEHDLSASTTEEDRVRYRNRLEELRRERRDAREELRDLQPRIYYLQRRVDDLRYEIGDRWMAW